MKCLCNIGIVITRKWKRSLRSLHRGEDEYSFITQCWVSPVHLQHCLRLSKGIRSSQCKCPALAMWWWPNTKHQLSCSKWNMKKITAGDCTRDDGEAWCVLQSNSDGAADSSGYVTCWLNSLPCWNQEKHLVAAVRILGSAVVLRLQRHVLGKLWKQMAD